MKYKQAKQIIEKYKEGAIYILYAVTPDNVRNVCIENEIDPPINGLKIKSILDCVNEKIEFDNDNDFAGYGIDSELLKLVDDLIKNEVTK